MTSGHAQFTSRSVPHKEHPQSRQLLPREGRHVPHPASPIGKSHVKRSEGASARTGQFHCQPLPFVRKRFAEASFSLRNVNSSRAVVCATLLILRECPYRHGQELSAKPSAGLGHVTVNNPILTMLRARKQQIVHLHSSSNPNVFQRCES